jgi:hypothetical protein
MPYTLASDSTLATPATSAIAVRDTSLTDYCLQYPTACVVHKLLSTVGLVTGVFHGYRRNRSVGWALGWGLLGAMFPYITIPVAFAQGFGKPQVA